MIRIADLSKRYPGAARPALAGISLDVPRGCAFGLLGPNGAGKTTLISILTGLLLPDAGTAQVDGIDVARDPHAVKRRIGFVPQDLAFYPALSVDENLRLFAQLTPGYTTRRRDFAIHTADLGAQLGKRAETLSGGLKRRLNLAIGLLGEPQLLLLDEPTAGVDPQSRNFLIEAVQRLRGEGLTVIYTTHYMEEIERACERVAILDHGRIVAQGAIAELLQGTDRNLEALFLRLTGAALRDEPA